jgi:hypothetical protein
VDAAPDLRDGTSASDAPCSGIRRLRSAAQWERILHHDFWLAFRRPAFRPRLASFLVGTTLLRRGGGAFAYLLARA